MASAVVGVFSVISMCFLHFLLSGNQFTSLLSVCSVLHFLPMLRPPGHFLLAAALKLISSEEQETVSSQLQSNETSLCA